jgi:CRISPR-associated protein Cmr6
MKGEKPKKIIQTSGSNKSLASSQPIKPSPWLDPENVPAPNAKASFVEYLRWLRQKTGNGTTDSNTVVELYSKFEASDYSIALTRMTSRTKKLAHWFTSVKCPWRIRVGGAKGPESMLLPAFDSQGLPYIPSSTLRGIARAVAMRDKNYRDQVDVIFGNVDPQHTCMGQVTFLDAYPLPGKDKKGGLKPDMANAIWTWGNDQTLPEYSPNPNNFLSLNEPTFVIGLRKDHCTDEIFELVKRWLLNGLAQGIGSQVNTGYGALHPTQVELEVDRNPIILQIPFELEGQLIHGRQEYDRPRAESEVRPVAFRGMLRYWFRVLASGFLEFAQIRKLEKEIFGGIEPSPSNMGLFRVEVQEVKSGGSSTSSQKGKLVFRVSSQALALIEKKEIKRLKAFEKLVKNLTWLMFFLGGVGQGSRRPYYTRSTSPRVRGCRLTLDSDAPFWQKPKNQIECKDTLLSRLKDFYETLKVLSSQLFDIQHPISTTRVTNNNWTESIDKNAVIVVCSGESQSDKPYALDILHDYFHNLKDKEKNYSEAKNLCGGTHKDKIKVNSQTIERKAIPSPVWVSDHKGYQIVTVFGTTAEPRNKYLKQLEENAEKFDQIWPML